LERSQITGNTHRHPGEGRGPGKIKKTWIPASAGMTAKTPATVSLLGFSTSDGQLDIILGNYYKAFL
jgi:hypothetical protein